MLVTIITPTLNSSATLGDTLLSINSQSYKYIEHIIVDGGSMDNTLSIANNAPSSNVHRIVYSGEDKGIYDAMNKGFELASGQIVCVLNSDDYYSDQHVIHQVVESFQKSPAGFVYGDADIVRLDKKFVRRWSVGDLKDGVSQIPHPSLWVKKSLIGAISPPFDIKYTIAADLKFQLILTQELKLDGFYIERSLVTIRLGGTSTRNLSAYLQGWKQSRDVFNEVLGGGGITQTFLKVLRKFAKI
jgi:glycosyltransferase involved in cell wall biosynthesis